MLDPSIQKSFDQRFSITRRLNKEVLLPPEAQRDLTMENAGQHCFFTFMDKTYFVEDLHRYHETDKNFQKKTGFVSTELGCLCLENGHRCHFEWEIDDALEVSLTLWQIKFRELTDEEGIQVDEDDLDQIARDRDAVVYKGEKFWYEDDWAAIYEGKNADEQVFIYEFENEPGTTALTIEEWKSEGREEYRLYISRPIVPQDITLLTKGE